MLDDALILFSVRSKQVEVGSAPQVHHLLDSKGKGHMQFLGDNSQAAGDTAPPPRLQVLSVQKNRSLLWMQHPANQAQ